jgi:hypothetical protein
MAGVRVIYITNNCSLLSPLCCVCVTYCVIIDCCALKCYLDTEVQPTSATTYSRGLSSLVSGLSPGDLMAGVCVCVCRSQLALLYSPHCVCGMWHVCYCALQMLHLDTEVQ